MTNIKLIATDLDGTLLDDEKHLSPANLQALSDAADRGIFIVPATGRYYEGIPEEIRSLPFIRYCITINGAQLYDVRADKVIYEANIPLNEAERIWAYCDTLPVIYDCYQYNRGYISSAHYPLIDEYTGGGILAEVTKKNRIPIPNFLSEMHARGDSVQKIQMFFKDLEKRREVFDALPGLFPTMSVSSANYNNIEINAGGATKGAALQALLTHLNLPASAAMAFGDGTNDISMLKTAGMGIAMENGVPEAKAAARLTAPDNNNSGVAVMIMRLAL